MGDLPTGEFAVSLVVPKAFQSSNKILGFDWLDRGLICEAAGAMNVKFGTLVNGQPIERSALRSGDRLTIGIRTFRVSFHLSRERLAFRELEKC